MKPEEYKKERKRRGLSQAAFAELTGVGQATVSNRERGVYPITKEAELALRSLPKRKGGK